MFKYFKRWNKLIIKYNWKEYVLYKDLYNDFLETFEQEKIDRIIPPNKDAYFYFLERYTEKIENKIKDIIWIKITYNTKEEEKFFQEFHDWIWEKYNLWQI